MARAAEGLWRSRILFSWHILPEMILKEGWWKARFHGGYMMVRWIHVACCDVVSVVASCQYLFTESSPARDSAIFAWTGVSYLEKSNPLAHGPSDICAWMFC